VLEDQCIVADIAVDRSSLLSATSHRRQVAVKARRTNCEQSVAENSGHVLQAFGHHAPPHPPASLLARDQASLGKNPGVVRDGWLTLA
jgi:hypothetical protein